MEDDGTQIIANDFTQIGGVPYKIGSNIRERYANEVDGLSAEIQNTVIEANKMP